MFVSIGDLIEGILSFLADIWLFRRDRASNGRPENSWKKDAADLAYLEWLLSAALCAVAVIVFLFLFYFIGLAFGVSFFIAVAPVALYLAYRWVKLLMA